MSLKIKTSLVLAITSIVLSASSMADDNEYLPPTTITEQDRDQALYAFNHHHKLPGLPDLRKPVFIRKGSLVCDSPGALVNPVRYATIMIGACAVIQSKKKVLVLAPKDAGQYIEDYLFRYIAVTWGSEEMSNANSYIAWTPISALRN